MNQTRLHNIASSTIRMRAIVIFDFFKIIFAGMLLCASLNANATITVIIQPSGSNVVATATGTITITSTPINGGSLTPGFDGNGGVGFAPVSYTGSYSTLVVPVPPVNSASCSGITHALALSPNSTSGLTTNFFRWNYYVNGYVVPTTAALNDVLNINGSLTFNNKTIAGLGMAPGTYDCQYTGQYAVNSIKFIVTNTPAPTVTSVSPSAGPVAGGTSVTITGADFTGATGVTIGGVAATAVTVNSSTSITATVPAGASGTASVVVTTAVGSNAANTLYTYVTPSALTVLASPSTLNSTTTTSTLSTSGGNGTGAVTYAMTAGTCTVSGNTVTAGTATETCTVTATKASDGAFSATTATVNITVARRANIAVAATDASVLAIHGAQVMQSQTFVTAQIENVTSHLNAYRSNFKLRPSRFGFGVKLPSLGPASQALYKIKDAILPRPDMQAFDANAKSGFVKVGYQEEKEASPYNDTLRGQAPKVANAEHKQHALMHAPAGDSDDDNDNLTYSFWTAGTIDLATFGTGDNKDILNKLTAQGLTMGFDYKLADTAIIGAAVGVGSASHNAQTITASLKGNQAAVMAYGMFGFAGHWVADGLIGYGMLDFSGNRTTSDGAAQLSMNRKGNTFYSSATVSSMYWIDDFMVAPFLRQDVMKINLHSYAETGAADYALGFDGTNFLNATISAGVQVSRDLFVAGGKLTPSVKLALNSIRAGGLVQNIYYADTGAAGGVYTMNHSSNSLTTESLRLGLVYANRAGDGFEIGWQGAMGANHYRISGLRVSVRFAM